MTREQLTAILTATRDEQGLYLDDERYIDWSTRTDDGRIVFEVGDAGATVQLDLSHEQMEALVHRLAATLLAEKGE